MHSFSSKSHSGFYLSRGDRSSAEETWGAQEGSSWIEAEGAQTRIGEVWFWEEEISPGVLGPDHWARYLDDLLPAYRPHAVITVFFLRDGTFLPTSLMLNKRYIDPIREKYLKEPLYGTSALVTYFRNRLAWQDYTELFRRMLKSAYLETPRQRAT